MAAKPESMDVEVQSTETATLLCVDDETSILKALKRVFRPQGYTILTAESGKEGLEVLAKERVDLVISDMRMPQMSGAQFLSQVADTQPDIVRILLTGYSDLESTVSAVNDGRIYRYLSKPWDEGELRETVRTGLAIRNLEAERHRLQLLTDSQNEELKTLNEGLERRVEQRTEQLRKAYQDTITVFSQMIEAREATSQGHGRRVARLAKQMGILLGLKPASIRDLYLAALLHDVGKIGLSDEIVGKPINRLSAREREAYEQHVKIGPGLLASIPLLEEPAILIRHHHEHFDGNGFPDGLVGQSIPLGARIIAVADCYDGLCTGRILGNRHGSEAALSFLRTHTDSKFDPIVVDALAAVIAEQTAENHTESQLILSTEYLEPGMVLTKDVMSSNGMLLLVAETLLTEKNIQKLRSFESDITERLEIGVRA